MQKSSYGVGLNASTDPDKGWALTRNANEELARILGGIGALPDPLPPTDLVEALRKFAVVEWLP